jgi:choice-of-anchor C domain-containing protein
MRYVIFFSVFLVATLFVYAMPVPQKHKNLLTNGSFEEGPETNLMTSLNRDSQKIPGWVVTRGQIDYMGTFWDHQEGKRSIDLHGSPGYGGIKQTFKTRKGVRYKLSFYLASTPGCAKPKKTMEVDIDGKTKSFECDSKGQNKLNWKKQTINFTATDTETTIEFYTLETEDPNCGPAIDNVEVMEAK